MKVYVLTDEYDGYIAVFATLQEAQNYRPFDFKHEIKWVRSRENLNEWDGAVEKTNVAVIREETINE